MTISCQCADCGAEINRPSLRYACAVCFERRESVNPTRCLSCVLMHRYDKHPEQGNAIERADDDFLVEMARQAADNPILRRTLELGGWTAPAGGKLFTPEGSSVIMRTTERLWDTGHDACRGLGCPTCCPVDAT